MRALAGELRKLKVGGFLFQKFAEQESLPGQLVGPVILGKEIDQFVAKDGGATGLENDDGNPGFDFGSEGVQYLEQQALGPIQHAEIVERAAAAENGSGIVTRNPAASSTSTAALAVSGRK